MQLDLENASGGDWSEVLPHDGSALLRVSWIEWVRADALFAQLMAQVPWQSHDLVLFGKKMKEPRLSAWVADPGVSYTYSGARRVPQPWTPALTELRHLCESTLAPRFSGVVFNSVLANLYRSGDDSMGWHADDEPELGPTPVIASLSFGDERRFDFRHRTTGETVQVVLPHGSLLVMSGATQSHWKHRLAKTKAGRGQRINLTFRFVLPSPTRA